MILGFNSLQTGKAFRTPKECEDAIRLLQVSIPFKRERLSELLSLPLGLKPTLVSIPFKRERLSELFKIGFGKDVTTKFQFPSNGKGFPNFLRLWIFSEP